MATLTKRPDGDEVWGKARFIAFQLAPTAADYVTGGYAITPANTGFKVVSAVEIVFGPLGWLSQWNSVTGKVQVFGGTFGAGAAGTEAAAGTDLSASQGFRLRVFGT